MRHAGTLSVWQLRFVHVVYLGAHCKYFHTNIKMTVCVCVRVCQSVSLSMCVCPPVHVNSVTMKAQDCLCSAKKGCPITCDATCNSANTQLHKSKQEAALSTRNCASCKILLLVKV